MAYKTVVRLTRPNWTRLFKEDGFSTGTYYIKELDVTFTVGSNQPYKEEIVSNINQRITEIEKRYGMEKSNNQHSMNGYCGEMENPHSDLTGYIVLIKNNQDHLNTTFFKGHEYGHLLDYLGLEDLIYSRLNPEIKQNVSDAEEFASLCGWIATKRAGYDVASQEYTENPALKENATKIQELFLKYEKQ